VDECTGDEDEFERMRETGLGWLVRRKGVTPVNVYRVKARR